MRFSEATERTEAVHQMGGQDWEAIVVEIMHHRVVLASCDRQEGHLSFQAVDDATSAVKAASSIGQTAST
jgi:hypothetical protein